MFDKINAHAVFNFYSSSNMNLSAFMFTNVDVSSKDTMDFANFERHRSSFDEREGRREDDKVSASLGFCEVFVGTIWDRASSFLTLLLT